MESKEAPYAGEPQPEQHAPQEGGLLTNAARAVGTAIGKVSSTLGLAHVSDKPKSRVSKPIAKKKSTAKKKQAPYAKKVAAKKTGDGKPRKAAKKR